MIILLRVVLLMVSKESIQLDALFKVFHCFHAPDLFEEIKVAVDINTGSDKSVPVDALKLNVGIVLLKLKVYCFVEVDIGSLDCMHILSGHLKLIEIEILGEHLHLLRIVNFII